MAHGTVACCFTDTVEKGCEGYLVGLYRCQAYKVCQKMVRERKYNSETDKWSRIGNKILKRKGDLELVDCSVTGTDRGTASKPKFALRDLWEFVLLPEYEALVGPGGDCEGAIVVHQEDNAGPHKEGNFHDWLNGEFEKRGWKLELQAPQGPYTNVLDLYLFPGMSKRHSELLQLYSNTEATKDRIWAVAQSVWADCSSAMVARAFILAFRIMRKFIEENANNQWLCEGTPHCNVRRDFYDTLTGVLPRPNQHNK